MAETIIRNRAQVRVAADHAELGELAAEMFAEVVAQYNQPTVLFPAGRTQETAKPGMVDTLLATSKTVHIGNLDEYCFPVGNNKYKLISPRHPQSFRRNLRAGLLDRLDGKDNIHHYFPDTENIGRPSSYDDFLYTVLGGVALTIDGLGEDGHIMGFNQRGIGRFSVTRLTFLDAGLRAVNQRKYETAEAVPPAAITVGVDTCLRSDQGLTLVSGESKAAAMRRAIYDGISPDWPATFWREHPNHLWLVDQAAAADL